MKWDDAIKLALESGWKNKPIVLSHTRWSTRMVPQEWCYHVIRKGSDAERAFRSTR